MAVASDWRMAVGAPLVRALVTALGRSYRIVVRENHELVERLREARESAIFCFWHNRIINGSLYLRDELAFKGYLLNVLISRSRDGEMIARAIEAWGGRATRGSSSRGGSRALRELRRFFAGQSGGVVTTPDGPRGPVERVQPGTIVLAQLTGVPIYPLSCSAERAWRLDSWDGFIVPKPFSRVAISVHEPIRVPRELDEREREEARLHVEQALHTVDARAAALFGGG
jgi:lysophospholipid acyltransferase (LPLAT)-like uncharacterized protein